MIETAIICLALNIYHEARGEPIEGQKAVAQVTMNRARHNPSRVCDEVFRPGQFSWADKLTKVDPIMRVVNAQDLVPTDWPAYWRAKDISRRAIEGGLPDVVGNADHFYNPDLVTSKPYWATVFQFVTKIGGHRFYYGG